jgi:hypothetical protein
VNLIAESGSGDFGIIPQALFLYSGHPAHTEGACLYVESHLITHDGLKLLRAQMAPRVAERAVLGHSNEVRIRHEDARNHVLRMPDVTASGNNRMGDKRMERDSEAPQVPLVANSNESGPVQEYHGTWPAVVTNAGPKYSGDVSGTAKESGGRKGLNACQCRWGMSHMTTQPTRSQNVLPV